MLPIRACVVAATILLHSGSRQDRAHPAPARTEIAPGVFLFRTEPYGDVGLDGNAVAVVTNAGVLVFDANGTPAAASAVIARLKEVTRQPVRYLVLSHWHWDHWYGVAAYRAAFPDVEVIAQERTRALMAGPAIAFNQPGLDDQLPGHIRAVEAAEVRARTSHAADSTVARLTAHAASDRWFLAQKRSGGHALPTRTFVDTLTITLGGRVLQLWTPGHAITPGDAALWLPAERIAIVGDLLINPITFGLFCYPSGWIGALDHIDALHPALIVPGHGQPLRDLTLLRDTRALLVRELELARAAKAAGNDPRGATSTVLADSTVLALRERITGGVAARNQEFALYLVEWVVTRIYQELDGTLDDSIPRTP